MKNSLKFNLAVAIMVPNLAFSGNSYNIWYDNINSVVAYSQNGGIAQTISGNQFNQNHLSSEHSSNIININLGSNLLQAVHGGQSIILLKITL